MINNSLISNFPPVYKFPQLSHKCFSTVGLFKLGFKKDPHIEFSCSVP